MVKPIYKSSSLHPKFGIDKLKIYNRIPAREWIPTKEGYKDVIRRKLAPYDILKSYFFNDDNTAQNYVDLAKSLIDSNVSEEIKDDAISYLAHEDAKDQYLGLPQRTGLVIKSNFKPSKSKHPNTNYFKFKHLNGDYWNKTGVLNDLIDFNVSDGITSKQYVDPTLNTFTASIGTDKNKGQYLSIYDIWDYNKKIEGGGEDNIGKIIGGKPFEIYDRVYLDDYYKINSKPKKGDYFGTYLPELVVTNK